MSGMNPAVTGVVHILANIVFLSQSAWGWSCFLDSEFIVDSNPKLMHRAPAAVRAYFVCDK